MTARSKESIVIYVMVTILGLGSSITGALFAVARVGDDRYVKREEFVQKFSDIKTGIEVQKTDLDYIRKAVDELRKSPKADVTSCASMSRKRRGGNSMAHRLTD